MCCLRVRQHPKHDLHTCFQTEASLLLLLLLRSYHPHPLSHPQASLLPPAACRLPPAAYRTLIMPPILDSMSSM
jgi:hypothetical protein